MARVGLVFGGRSVEHKVSVRSARTVAEALTQAGHEVVPLAIAPDGAWLPAAVGRRALDGELDALPAGGPQRRALPEVLDGTPDRAPEAAGGLTRTASGAPPEARKTPEVLFPIVHGTWGEDGSLQGLFEILGTPYVGAGVAASALAMDKRLCRRLLDAAGVPQVAWRAVTRVELEDDREAVLSGLGELPLPVFVKPAVGGSSVGVSKVTEHGGLGAALEHALTFDDAAVVERGVENARELECAVLGYPRLEASVAGEVVPGNDFYDYADKYLDDRARLEIPARLPTEVEARLRQIAIEAFAAVAGSGMARVDFLLEGEDTLWVNEINTLPGFTSISMYPKLWEASGVALPELVDRLVQDALARHGDRRRLDDGIRRFLADLG